MERNNIIKSMMDSITPEMEERFKQERIEWKNSLTAEYQLGHYVGLEIVHNYLPTLSTDMLVTWVF